jgi:heme ABC exporter ATP-binding subunit CcmA
MNATTERPLIELRDLAKAYGFLPVLRGITLDIARGDFVGLLGANGSGKSTLLKLLCGLTKPTQGSIRIGGWDIPQEAHAVRPQIGFVSHKSLLYPTLTGYENLAFFARLYGIAPERSALSALVARVGLSKAADRPARTYSRGMLQRLSIARALLQEPHLLLLDEPYTGLDQDASATLDGLLQGAHSEGRTLIMTSHDLASVARLARRIVILSRGKVAYDAPNANFTAVALAELYADVTGERHQ